MREIKFRAWDEGEKRMIYMRDKLPERYEIKEWNELGYRASLTWLLGDSNDFIWMQYTGLKDKNGKEIYEGDICKQNFNGEDQQGGITIEITRGVMVGNYPVWHHNVEIIGNIYENKDLM